MKMYPPAQNQQKNCETVLQTDGQTDNRGRVILYMSA